MVSRGENAAQFKDETFLCKFSYKVTLFFDSNAALWQCALDRPMAAAWGVF